MIAFVFGDEKKAKPSPRNDKFVRTAGKGVEGDNVESRRRLAPVSPMPTDETILGSTRSDSLPAKGVEKSATGLGTSARAL